MPARCRIRDFVLPISLPPGAALLAAVLFALVALVGPASAQIGSDRYSSIVIDAATGNVLSEVSADEPRYPASLTKMMTLYMVFEALRDRRISLNQNVPVTAHAASMSPSKLGLTPRTPITVEQAILGLVTLSANDAAAALGELLGGNEERFAQMMTLRARALGMSHSVFRNASGLPDLGQITTARDLATLGRHLVRDFPTEYRWFSTPSFTWRRRVIPNHDHLIETYPGADGIKTGYVVASGHNLATSAQRSGVRLIGVVMGAGSNGSRDVHMAALLDQGFERMGIGGGRSAMPTLVSQASAAPPPRRAAPPRWSVQVGAFASETAARQAANQARRAADDGEARVEAVTVRGKTTWRALLTGLSQPEVRQACTALAHHKIHCIPIRPEARQLADR